MVERLLRELLLLRVAVGVSAKRLLLHVAKGTVFTICRAHVGWVASVFSELDR